MKSVSDVLDVAKIEYCLLSSKEGFSLHREWLEIFAVKVKELTGKYTVGNYVWEAYSSGILSSTDGANAVHLYHSKPQEDYYVIYENGREVFDCCSGNWPDFFGIEAIVFPKSKTWSMIYSHEETEHYVEPEI